MVGNASLFRQLNLLVWSKIPGQISQTPAGGRGESKQLSIFLIFIVFMVFPVLFSGISTVHAENYRIKILILHSYHHEYEWTKQITAGIRSNITGVVDGFSQGKQAALLAVRILQGESPENISVFKPSPNIPVFDYNAMLRFGINRSDLPKGSVVLNIPSSLYTDYKSEVWSTIIIVFCLLIFILLLLDNIRARKRVEQELKNSKNEIKTILDNATTQIWSFDGKQYLYISREWYRYTGQDASLPLTLENWTEPVHPDDIERVLEIRQQAWKNRKKYDNYFRLRNAQGEYRWMYCHAVPVFDGNGDLSRFTGFNIDIHEIRQAEKQYKAIIQTSIDGFWMVDLQTHLIEVNDAFCRILGYNREELLQMKVSDISTMETQEDRSRHIRKIIEKGGDSFESLYQCKDGTLITVQVTVQYIDIKKGIFVSFIKDITERKANLQALENSEKRYKSLFAGAPVMYIVTEIQKGSPVVTDCNKLFLKILGYTRTDVVGKSLAVFYTDLSQKRMMEDIDHKRNMEESFLMSERELITHDGRIVSTLTQASPEYDTQGNVIGIRVMFVDISAQVKAEEQLIESQNMLQMIVDGISDPLIMVDKNMNVLMHNRAAMKYYDVDDMKNCISMKCYEAFNGNPDVCEGCPIPMAVSSLKHLAFERKGIKNSERLEQITIYPVKYEDHGWAAIISINDITETRLMEKELIQADKMISIGILVSGVAHEINNPNNFIMLNTSLLSEVWEDIVPVIEKYYRENGDFVLAGLPYSEIRNEIPLLFKGITDGAQRIKQIVEDLKDYTRKSGTEMDQSVNMNKVIESAVRLTGNLIKKSTEKFNVIYGRNLPMIEGNKQKLEQVVINLIQNACQALSDKEEGILITSFFDKEIKNVVVQVQDEGRGIPEKIRARIMDPFFTTRRGHGGTGLGLSVSSNIIKAHNGRIEIADEIDKGSIFRVIIPAHRVKKTVKILVVDDDPGIREVLCIGLAMHKDYSVSEASSGNEAFLKIGQEIPDFLILDIQMPGVDGVEICRLLTKDPKLSGINVIIITGFIESYAVKEIADMGFNKILVKPFSVPDLEKIIDEILEIKQ